MNIPFKRADILLPKDVDMTKWSVIACDQYTSELEYWKKVKEIVSNNPSTLNLILPEVYLEEKDVDERIKNINNEMDRLLNNNFFKEYDNSMIYVERKQSDGLVREGLIGIVDLEDYSYEENSKSLIRATEKTVIDRIPPRVKVRQNASLELPHIMLLIDDDNKEIIESLKYEPKDKLYDFDLMMNGGSIKGYKLKDNTIDKVLSNLEYLCNSKEYNKQDKLLFAVGDGNHSLATAKKCYELNKNNLLSRYALVELVNLHSSALKFEAIHRVLFNIDRDKFLKELNNYYDINDKGIGQKFELYYDNKIHELYISNPKSNIPVGSMQLFIDDYLKSNNGKVDYIHGEDSLRKLCTNDKICGIIYAPMKKEDLFNTVMLDGSLPRKTFSMGHSEDKRYYLECRRILRR